MSPTRELVKSSPACDSTGRLSALAHRPSPVAGQQSEGADRVSDLSCRIAMDTSEIVLPPSPADGAAAKTHGIDPFIALLRAADRGLSPLLGRRGSLALLRRTLALGRQRFGWLHAAQASHDFDQATAGLRASLAGR